MTKTVNKTRRRLLIGGAVAAPVLGLAIMRPGQVGGAHNTYFLQLQQALQQANLYRPTLVVDQQKLQQNIATMMQRWPKNKAFRVVAKSLPSMPLLQSILQTTGSNRIMAFHQPFLNAIAQQLPDADVLMGKPMPIGAVERFYTELPAGSDFNPTKQVAWLVDSLERLQRYAAFAASGQYGSLRIVLELDIGLHRGGFSNVRDTAKAVELLQQSTQLNFAGFMGYEPHIVKIPDILGGVDAAKADALADYQSHVDAAKNILGATYRPEELILNIGGSQTYQLYDDNVLANEIALGSGLVKPTDFDLPTLADHEPATYIATPVIKKTGKTQIPGLGFADGILNWYDRNSAQSFFIYGGYWKAQYESPPGLQDNGLYGNSTNQHMVNGSVDVQLNENDLVFLRPTQSEFVYLQFGDIAVYDNGKITEYWPVFQQNPVSTERS